MTPEQQKALAASPRELLDALERADKLINWMAGYIGNMAPGSYGDCYADLNSHGIFMSSLHANASKLETGT